MKILIKEVTLRHINNDIKFSHENTIQFKDTKFAELFHRQRYMTMLGKKVL